MATNFQSKNEKTGENRSSLNWSLVAAALGPQASHLTTPAGEGPTRELVCLPSGVPTEEHHEGRRGWRTGALQVAKGRAFWPGTCREGLGAGSVECWELEGSSQGWGRGTVGEGTPSPSLQDPQSFTVAQDGVVIRDGKREPKRRLSLPPQVSCCRLLPARLLSELALRILPRDQNLSRSPPPETRKHSHHVHFALLLWTSAIPLGFQGGNASTWRPQGLAWPGL